LEDNHNRPLITGLQLPLTSGRFSSPMMEARMPAVTSKEPRMAVCGGIKPHWFNKKGIPSFKLGRSH
jgi:hypothetical protein